MRIFLILVATFLLAGPLYAASNQGTGRVQGFSCDVNTRKCTCSGIWSGADCEAMKKNCKDKTNPAGCNLSEGWCVCDMALRPGAKSVAPIDASKTLLSQ